VPTLSHSARVKHKTNQRRRTSRKRGWKLIILEQAAKTTSRRIERTLQSDCVKPKSKHHNFQGRDVPSKEIYAAKIRN